MVSLALFMYACCDSAMPLLSNACAYAITPSFLPSFASPSSCTALLHDRMYCRINRWVCFREKSTLCNNFKQKGGWAYFGEITVQPTIINTHSALISQYFIILPSSFLLCRQFVPKQQQITIDFASIEGAAYDVKPSHDTSIVENSSCQQ